MALHEGSPSDGTSLCSEFEQDPQHYSMTEPPLCFTDTLWNGQVHLSVPFRTLLDICSYFLDIFLGLTLDS